MLTNRSIPSSTVIPVLAYPDVKEAAAWLSRVFGFEVRLEIGSHRVQMKVGDGAVILRDLRANEVGQPLGLGHSNHVRVEDVDAHCRRARAAGARIEHDPETHPYGERQYVVEDCGGHSWTFSETVKDADPADWMGAMDAPAATAEE